MHLTGKKSSLLDGELSKLEKRLFWHKVDVSLKFDDHFTI